MADRSIKINLGLNVSGLTAGFKTAQKSAEDFANKGLAKVEKNGQAIGALSTQVGALGLGLTAMAGVAVKKFADFDQAMSGVAATGEDARKSISALREAAIEAGADTAFSATEAAGAVEELSKAGVTAADILGGGLKGSLDLAAAGGLGVAEAAEFASIAMTQFKLEGKDVGHVADLLAAGAGKAMGDVTDLGQALKQGGLVAAATGLSIEETTATLSAFAAAGLLGSDAGTSLKTMLQRLSAPTGEAAGLMESLGISAYDASGEFVGMEAFAGQLTTALTDMTPAQRNATMATIFGADAVRAANIVYENGQSGIRDWIAAVDDQGYAAETAAVRMDNLRGDLEQLGGSFETLLIGMGEGADGPLRSLVQGLDGVVDSLNDLPDPAKHATALIAGGGGLALLGLAGMAKLTVGISETRTAMKNLGISGAKTTGVVKGLGKAAGVAGAALGVIYLTDALTNLADGGGKAVPSVEAATKSILALDGATVNASFAAKNVDDITQALDALTGGGGVTRKLDKWASELDGIFGTTIISSVHDSKMAFQSYDAALAALVSGGNAEEAAAGVATLYGQVDQSRYSLNDILKQLPSYQAALDGVSNEAILGADAQQESASALDKYSRAVVDGTATTEGYVDALREMVDAQREAAGVVLSERDAMRAYESAIDDAAAALKENGATLDISTEKGRANQAALDDVAKSGWDLVDSMVANGASQEDVTATMKKSRDGFIKLADKMGLSKKEAKKLADELGLIPGDVKVTVDFSGYSKTAAELDAISRKLSNIAGKRVDIGTGRGGHGGLTYSSGGGVSGPGTGTSDSIPAMLSNGEHVWTAREVAAAGGQGAMYRARGLVRAGALRFAVGGAVGDSDKAVTRAAKAKKSAQAALREEKGDAASAQRAYDRAEGAAAKKSAKKRLDAAKKDLKAAENALRDADKALSDARARRSRLREDRADFGQDVRRGRIGDQISGGLDSSLSVVDRARDLADSGDLSKKQSASLRKASQEAEKALTKQYGLLDKQNEKIDKTKALLSDVKGLHDSVAASIMGEVRLTDLLNQKTEFGHDKPVTAGSIRAYVADKLAKVKGFNSKLNALRKRGAPNALLQEVLASGIDGGTALATALLSASAGDWGAITRDWRALEEASSQTGDIATQSQYGTTVAQTEALLASQEKQADKITAEITKIGKGLQKALGKQLGFASGGLVSGAGTGTSDSILARLSNGEHVTNAASTAANYPLLKAINDARGPVSLPAVSVQSGVSAAQIAAALMGMTVQIAASVGVDRKTSAAIVGVGVQEVRRTDPGILRGVSA